jgi:hypothetical protein
MPVCVRRTGRKNYPVNPWPRPGLANLVVDIKFLKSQYQYAIISVRRARAGLLKIAEYEFVNF